MDKDSRVAKKFPAVLMIAAAVLLATAVPVFAWFSLSKSLSRTDDIEIDMPPIIYIRDDNLKDITSFNLDNLRINGGNGESNDYNMIFCVSPTIVGSVDNFFLGIIYTENLGMNINIYPVYSVTDEKPGEGVLYKESTIKPSGETEETTCYFEYRKEKTDDAADITNLYEYKLTYGDWTTTEPPAKGSSLNNGIYKSYENLKFGDVIEEPTELIDRLNDKSRLRFFVLNITWDENADADNVKEADVVYIITKGKQH